MRLKDKSAIVTGGSAGIGRAIAKAMIGEGARVLICAQHETSTRKEAESIGAEWSVFEAGDAESIKQMIDVARDRFGKLDILVNNAAIATPALPIQETEEVDLARLIAVNLKGYFTAMKFAYPMLKETQGCVLNISSMAGVTGQQRHAAYAATKGGINALTKSAAADWGAERIRVNALCPAGVWTDSLRVWCDEQPNKTEIKQYLDRIHSLGYCPGPEEISSVALFLCSDEAKFMTGAIVPVSGGSECGYKL